MSSRSQTRGERAIAWVESWCVRNGRPARLSPDERSMLYGIFDAGRPTEDIVGPLAAFLVLLHLAGPEARPHAAVPRLVTVDLFTLWNAAGPELRGFLRRHGQVIACPELNTTYGTAA